MGDRKLTQQQQRALARDRHISVMANAGSGKTTVLTDKYIDILLNDEKVAKDPARILAITFTKVAASEMKTRVIKAIDKIIDGESEQNRMKTLYNIRERLSYAKISTIHSFCSSILREYPIEAGIAPNFTELSEFEISSLKAEAIENVFEDILKPEADTSKRYTIFFDTYGLNTIKKYIESIASKRDMLDDAQVFYDKDKSEIKDFFETKKYEYTAAMVKEFLSYLDATQADLPSSLPEKAQATFENLRNRIRSLGENIARNGKLEIKKVEEFCNVMKEKVGRSKFSTLVGKSLSKEEEVKEIEDKLSKLKSEQADIINNDDAYIDDAEMFIELSKKFSEEFSKLKDEISGVDFDDMICKVRDMLKNAEIAAKIRNEFAYILVDEFQDTNNSQYEIIKALVPSLNDNSVELDTRCFIVGDAKQSIYAFQGADVRVFKTAIKDIEKCNRQQITQGNIAEQFKLPNKVGFSPEYAETKVSEQERHGNLNLSTSFRLLPVPAAFVNYIFTNLTEPSPSNQSDYEVSYEELVCGRAIDTLFSNADEQKIQADEKFGSVSILLNIAQSGDNAGQATDSSEEEYIGSYGEAELVAKSIINITSQNSERKVLKNGEYVKPDFGDIAVLARSRKGFATLTDAMLRYKIPYVMQSGSGFYSASEIIDITQFLLFLTNEKDDLAFASILRSPFFGFYIEELFEIRLKGDYGDSLYARFKIYADSLPENSDSRAKCERALEIISTLQFYSTRVPVSSLLIKIIETGGYWGVVSKSPAGEQIEANFEKLIDYARKFEEKGFRTLNDFVEELVQLSIDSKEAEATFKTGENAVKIITVHGSKGTEFPIVYLYSTNFRPPNIGSPILDSDYRLNFRFKTWINDELQPVEQYITAIAKEHHKKIEEAEQKRLLYVALTRAKDHLIITAEVKPVKDGLSKPSGFYKYILKGLGQEADPPSQSGEIHLEPSKLKILSNGKFEERDFDFKVTFSTELPAEVEKPENAAMLPEVTATPSVKLSLEPIEPSFINGIYSASSLIEFRDEQEKYVLSNLLGMEESKLEYKASEESPSGMVIGSIIHSIMELIPKWATADGADVQKLGEFATAKLQNYGLPATDEISGRIIGECKAAAESEFIQKHLQQLIDAKLEYELNMPIGDDFITGYLDCLVEVAPNTYEVWDWKSNMIHSDNHLLDLGEHYKLQMEIYAMFVLLLYPDMPHCTCRLLFTNRAPRSVKDEDWIVSYKFERASLGGIKSKVSELIAKSKITT